MKILVTGGLGFIGVNTAARLSALGYEVFALDNYHREGILANEEWLRKVARDVRVCTMDVRNRAQLRAFVVKHKFDVIIHLAAQTSVPESVRVPAYDFDANAAGTFNVMEAARASGSAVIYASTNQVYALLPDALLREGETRWRYDSDYVNQFGVDETEPLAPTSLYGCSKLAGEHYVSAYARIYGLRTVIFRQSCVYGPRQLGVTDQGWLAHFVRSWVTGSPITIFGDGKQVRDMLYVDDLIGAYILTLAKLDTLQGQVFNIGGGPNHTTSIWWEFREMMMQIAGGPPPEVRFEDWRPLDHKVHITDNRRIQEALGWEPGVGIRDGIKRVLDWTMSTLKTRRRVA